MSPILHAMFIKPFGTEFTRKKGKVYSWVCDRDNMLFDANGNMIIDTDGLPKIIGVPKEPLPKQRKKYTINQIIGINSTKPQRFKNYMLSPRNMEKNMDTL